MQGQDATRGTPTAVSMFVIKWDLQNVVTEITVTNVVTDRTVTNVVTDRTVTNVVTHS